MKHNELKVPEFKKKLAKRGLPTEGGDTLLLLRLGTAMEKEGLYSERSEFEAEMRGIVSDENKEVNEARVIKEVPPAVNLNL